MILKKEYKSGNVINYTLIDNIEKIDYGMFDNGEKFINVYYSKRSKPDEFETIKLDGITAYLMNNNGKTLNIYK